MDDSSCHVSASLFISFQVRSQKRIDLCLITATFMFAWRLVSSQSNIIKEM